MDKSLNKAFSTFVALVTVLSSVMTGSFGFASAASAATLSTGDLIKASGPAVYYYAQDAKRYVFPNEKTYFSWYKDFSSVKTISDGELAAITIGGNVTMRPGTKLVKIQTDPKTYAVTKCGTLHWIESESVAKSLYGDAWATRVVDVPDAFFVNYTIGSSVATAVHPDGQVVTYAGDSNNYVVWGGQKRKFASQSAFDANMLNPLNSVVTTITYPNGADVTGREADLADVVCAGAPVVGGNLMVALASDTPAGATIPKNSSSVPLAKYVFSAGSGDVVITGLTLHRVGVGAASDWSNIYLYDQNGKRLTTGRTINSTSQTATFSSLNLTVASGGMQSIYVYGDASTPGSTGGQHSFEIMDAASVAVTSGTVGGSFPVRGNVFTIGTTSAARVDVTKGGAPANPTIGSTDVEVANFKLTANTNNVLVNQVTLYQSGSITNSDLTNFKLYQGTTVVATAASVGTDGHIVLKFTPAFLIGGGTTKVFSLHATVGGRSDRTIHTYVEYTTDVNAIDTVYNSGAAIDIATNGTYDGSGFTAGTGGCDTPGFSSCVVTQGGTLTNAFNGPPASNIAKGQLAVPLYKFSLTAQNTLEIKKIAFTLAATTGGTCGITGHDQTTYFRSLKVKNLDTQQTMMGPKELTAATDATTETLSLTDSFNLQAGQTMNLAIVTDIANAEVAGGKTFIDCGYKVTLKAFGSSDVRIVDTGEFLSTSKIVPNADNLGNQVTVKASSLTVALAGSPSSNTIVKKSQNVPVAGFVLTAGAQSNVLVTSLSLSCQGQLASTGNAFGNNAAAKAACAQRITALSLWNGTMQVGLSAPADTTTGKATISNMNLSIPAGTSLILEAHATFGSTASTTAPYDQVAVGIATGDDITSQDGDSNTVSPSLSAGVTAQSTGAAPSVIMTILNSGVVSYNTDSNPASTIVVAGKDVWVPFASYKATAQYEAMEIDRVAVLASSTAGLSSDNSLFSAVAVASAGAVKGQDSLSAGTTGTKDIDLTANKIVIPAGGSVSFMLWAKLANVMTSSTATSGVPHSGMAPAMGLMHNLQTGEWDANYADSATNGANIRATGQSSGERVYAPITNASHGNYMIVRKTKPMVAKQALSATTLADTDMDLMKFQVASDAQATSYVKQIIFKVTLSGITLSNFRLRKGSSDMATADVSIRSATSNTDLVTGTMTMGDLIVVRFTNEESITTSGNVYTLHATVSGAGTSDAMSVQFYRDPTAPIVTGYLVSGQDFGGVSSTNAVAVSTAAAEGGAASATGTFLWADGSEIPHSYAVGAGSSRDWTNDVLIEDLSQTQTLSR